MALVKVQVDRKDHLQPDGSLVSEHLIWLKVPAAGGDGMLLGVVQSELAATQIAAELSHILEYCSIHA